MDILFDLLFNVLYISSWMYISKMIVVPLFTFLIYWLISIIFFKIFKLNERFEFKYFKTRLIVLIATVVVFNVYFFFLVRSNGVYLFNWSSFPFTKENIYFLLLPQIISYIAVLWYFLHSVTTFKNRI